MATITIKTDDGEPATVTTDDSEQVTGGLESSTPEGDVDDWDDLDSRNYKAMGLDETKVGPNEGESRTIVARLTLAKPDADGDVVIPKGMILTRYKKLPIVLFGHDYYTMPIGKNLWPFKITDTEIIAKAIIRPEGRSRLADDLYSYVSDGFPLGVSIGFHTEQSHRPTEKDIVSHPEWAGADRIITKWTLYEWSFVTVPCNESAMALSVQKNKQMAGVLDRLGAIDRAKLIKPTKPTKVVRVGKKAIKRIKP